ncbi:hypothetical protein ABK040_012845 [Willaertia magna]
MPVIEHKRKVTETSSSQVDNRRSCDPKKQKKDNKQKQQIVVTSSFQIDDRGSEYVLMFSISCSALFEIVFKTSVINRLLKNVKFNNYTIPQYTLDNVKSITIHKEWNLESCKILDSLTNITEIDIPPVIQICSKSNFWNNKEITYIFCNIIGNEKKIAELKKLKYLKVHSKIKSIETELLISLTNLTYLNVPFVNDRDIEVINNLKQLQILTIRKECNLDLKFMNLININTLRIRGVIKNSMFSKFSKLTNLDISYCICDLVDFPSDLKILNVSNMNLEGYYPAFEKINNVVELNISNNPLLNINFIRNINKLQKLYAKNINNLTNRFVIKLIYLKQLEINTFNISSKTINNLTNLQYLETKDQYINLEKLNNLKTLVFCEANLKPNYIYEYHNITKLVLCFCFFPKKSSYRFSGLTRLRSLKLICQKVNEQELVLLKNLEHLSVTKTTLFTKLKELKCLTYLEVENGEDTIYLDLKDIIGSELKVLYIKEFVVNGKLFNNYNLTKLNINNCFVNLEKSLELPESLLELNISNVYTGLPKIKFIPQNLNNLTYLNINNKYKYQSYNDEVERTIDLNRLVNLKTLKAMHTNIKYENIRNCKNLVELHIDLKLRSLKIKFGAAYFERSLRYISYLEHLSIEVPFKGKFLVDLRKLAGLRKLTINYPHDKMYHHRFIDRDIDELIKKLEECDYRLYMEGFDDIED